MPDSSDIALVSVPLRSPAAIALPAATEIHNSCQSALNEDLGNGDLTASLIPANARIEAVLISRETAIFCGRPWAEHIFCCVDPNILLQWEVADGEAISAQQNLCTIIGPAQAILSAERCAINFLQTLSATATLTRRFFTAIAHTSVVLLDTRKTLPGLRQAQKYAVRCGGGRNHRMGLDDGVLIKENHIIAAGSITQAVQQAKTRFSETLIEVEVENLSQLEEACRAKADRVLLDNFSPELLREAVRITAGRLKLEASGNVTLKNIASIAETGVDFISAGALTKNIQAVDLSLRFREIAPQTPR